MIEENILAKPLSGMHTFDSSQRTRPDLHSSSVIKLTLALRRYSIGLMANISMPLCVKGSARFVRGLSPSGHRQLANAKRAQQKTEKIDCRSSADCYGFNHGRCAWRFLGLGMFESAKSHMAADFEQAFARWVRKVNARCALRAKPKRTS